MGELTPTQKWALYVLRQGSAQITSGATKITLDDRRGRYVNKQVAERLERLGLVRIVDTPGASRSRVELDSGGTND